MSSVCLNRLQRDIKRRYRENRQNILHYCGQWSKQWCHPRYEKPLKKTHFRSGKKYVETYSSSNAIAPDPEERVLYHINEKNKATVQFLKPKHKVVASVSERRTENDNSLPPNSEIVLTYPITVYGPLHRLALSSFNY